jgi:uncharacterized membrane protein YkvA (DUF1232 family)
VGLPEALLVVMVARLPDGILRDLTGFLLACATAVRRLRADPRVPRRAKVAVGFVFLWLLSPIDLVPEFLPVIGRLDDVVVVALALWYAARQVPRSVLLEASPANPSIIKRLLDPLSGLTMSSEQERSRVPPSRRSRFETLPTSPGRTTGQPADGHTPPAK